jgi:PadR family transcriptional regulator, regulatory protein PadR
MNLTYPTTLVLHALVNGLRHGFDVIDATGLASGTVYPILRRLELEGLVSASWEDVAIAQAEQRPPRRYYEVTPAGRRLLGTAVARYPVPRSIATRVRRLRPARSS